MNSAPRLSSLFPSSPERRLLGAKWRLAHNIMGTWRILAAVMLVSSLQTKRPWEVRVFSRGEKPEGEEST